MRVKNRMTRNPIVATLKTNYNEALQIMKQNNIKHLPIVNAKGKPVGIVTRANMLQAQPSPVTTLSVFEIDSWLDNVTMENIMNSPVLAVDESCSITNAAKFMLGNQIGSLLVMREKDMVGIITATDIFKTFIGITGGDQSGSLIEVRIPNQKGSLALFMQALSDAGSFIVSLAITDEDADYGYMDVKERGGDEEAIRKEIAKLDGVEVLSFHYSESDKLLSLGKK